jgi:ribosomal protein L31E
MELRKSEFIEKAEILIEKNDELGMIVLATLNRKKQNSPETSRAEQVEKLKAFVIKHFNGDGISKIWDYIKK